MKKAKFRTAEVQALYDDIVEHDRSPEVLKMNEALASDARKAFWRMWFPMMVCLLFVALASFAFSNPISGWANLIAAVAIPFISYPRS